MRHQSQLVILTQPTRPFGHIFTAPLLCPAWAWLPYISTQRWPSFEATFEASETKIYVWKTTTCLEPAWHPGHRAFSSHFAATWFHAQQFYSAKRWFIMNSAHSKHANLPSPLRPADPLNNYRMQEVVTCDKTQLLALETNIWCFSAAQRRRTAWKGCFRSLHYFRQ